MLQRKINFLQIDSLLRISLTALLFYGLSAPYLFTQSFTIQGANDYFQKAEASDKYNTFSANFIYEDKKPVHPKLGRIFPKRNGEKSYQIGLGLEMLTPSYLQAEFYQLDRPYAGLAYLQIAQQNKDFANNQSTEIRYKIGVIGKASQMDDLQYWLHQWRNYELPNWETQLKNAPILQAELREEYSKANPFSAVSGFAEASAGTLGLNTAIGGRFGVGNPKKGLSAFMEGRVKYVLSDATITETIFHRNNDTFSESHVYFPESSIEPIITSVLLGIQYQGKSAKISYQHFHRSADIINNGDMQWGIIELGFKW